MSEEDNNLALQTGENKADIENLEEKTDEIQEIVESIENRQKWNDEALDAAFARIWDLEARIEELQARISVLEIEAAEKIEEDLEELEISGEIEEDDITVIQPLETNKDEPQPNAKKHQWGLW